LHKNITSSSLINNESFIIWNPFFFTYKLLFTSLFIPLLSSILIIYKISPFSLFSFSNLQNNNNKLNISFSILNTLKTSLFLYNLYSFIKLHYFILNVFNLCFSLFYSYPTITISSISRTKLICFKFAELSKIIIGFI
jgi:hypothetical protein